MGVMRCFVPHSRQAYAAADSLRTSQTEWRESNQAIPAKNEAVTLGIAASRLINVAFNEVLGALRPAIDMAVPDITAAARLD
jgi:hypothetical protein